MFATCNLRMRGGDRWLDSDVRRVLLLVVMTKWDFESAILNKHLNGSWPFPTEAGSPVPRTRRRSHFVPSGASGAEASVARGWPTCGKRRCQQRRLTDLSLPLGLIY